MNAPKFWMVVPALLVAGAVGMAYAKLPPMDEAGKAKAAETSKKARIAEEKAMDRAVDHYKKEKGIKTATAAPVAKKK